MHLDEAKALVYGRKKMAAASERISPKMVSLPICYNYKEYLPQQISLPVCCIFIKNHVCFLGEKDRQVAPDGKRFWRTLPRFGA